MNLLPVKREGALQPFPARPAGMTEPGQLLLHFQVERVACAFVVTLECLSPSISGSLS